MRALASRLKRGSSALSLGDRSWGVVCRRSRDWCERLVGGRCTGCTVIVVRVAVAHEWVLDPRHARTRNLHLIYVLDASVVVVIA